MKILLGCDLAEGTDAGIIAALLEWVDLLSIPCAAEEFVRRAASAAMACNVRAGVLAGWADGEDGGSAVRSFGPRDLVGFLEEQVGMWQRTVDGGRGCVGHVKLRGALREACDERADLAEACVDWMDAEWEGVPLIVGAGGLLHAVAEARGVALWRGISADRAYAGEALPVPRGEPGAIISDADVVARQMNEWMATGFLKLRGGPQWLVEAETVCVQSDTPRIVDIARAVRGALGSAGDTAVAAC